MSKQRGEEGLKLRKKGWKGGKKWKKSGTKAGKEKIKKKEKIMTIVTEQTPDTKRWYLC